MANNLDTNGNADTNENVNGAEDDAEEDERPLILYNADSVEGRQVEAVLQEKDIPYGYGGEPSRLTARGDVVIGVRLSTGDVAEHVGMDGVKRALVSLRYLEDEEDFDKVLEDANRTGEEAYDEARTDPYEVDEERGVVRIGSYQTSLYREDRLNPEVEVLAHLTGGGDSSIHEQGGGTVLDNGYSAAYDRLEAAGVTEQDETGNWKLAVDLPDDLTAALQEYAS